MEPGLGYLFQCNILCMVICFSPSAASVRQVAMLLIKNANGFMMLHKLRLPWGRGVRALFFTAVAAEL